jgi:hypothetical protein
MSGVSTSSADLFSSIVGAGRNPGEPACLHAMLFSYFDDSSDSKREQYYAVGGLVATEERWTASNFCVNWGVATAHLTDPFRATDCETQHGQFQTWDKTECDKLMERLISIIIDAELPGFACVVPVQTYKAIFPNATLYDPYYLAIKSTVVVMAELGRENQLPYGFGGMRCWFEDGDVTDEVIKIYRNLRKVASWDAAKYLAPAPEIETKRLWQLQAADLVARESFKHFDNLGKRDTRIPVRRLDKRLNFSCWNRETLLYLRSHGGPDDDEAFTSWKHHSPPPPPFDGYWGENFNASNLKV